MKLWIVNQYAGTPNQPGHTRHWALAQEMSRSGIDSLIIASPTSYMTRSPSKPLARLTTHGAVSFLWLSAPAYRGNGLGRIINMLAFAFKAVMLPLAFLARGQLDRPAAVIGSSPSLFSAASAWCLAKFTRSAFVLEVRDIYPKTITALGYGAPSHPYVRLLGLLEKLLYRRADLIVSPLQAMGTHVEKTIGKLPDWAWVPNSVDTDEVPPPHPIRETPRPFKLTYAGAHGVPNSLQTIIQAAELLSGEDIEIRLIGDGISKKALIEEASRLQVNSVRFHDPVPKCEIFAHLQESDGLLFTIQSSPLFEDGFSPNKLYDYLASGRPVVISTDAPFNPVADAQAGITVSPQDPAALAAGIRELIAMPPDQRAMMGRRGREHVESHYALRTTAAVLAEALTKVATARTPRV